MARVASALGVMVNVEWPMIFKRFYKRMIVVKDIENIPPNKLFEMEQCIFLVSFDDDDDNSGNDTQQG
jgi:hypothetical protein